MNIDSLWDNFLEKIKPKISSLSYDTWFKNTKLVSLDNNVDKILVDSQLQKKRIRAKEREWAICAQRRQHWRCDGHSKG